jgi:NAD(P)-dependent dehydrogenase (short-subunit alcohol dehydrogenase family)
MRVCACALLINLLYAVAAAALRCSVFTTVRECLHFLSIHRYKHCLHHCYTCTLQAIEAAAHGTRVNAVAPGIVHTNLVGPGVSLEVFDDMAAPMQLITRAGKPEEIAKFVCFLLSDDASFTTGSILGIDGGASIVL